MDRERQRLYQVGRRIGVFSGLGDMVHPNRMARAQRAYEQVGGNLADLDKVTDELMKRFI
jgi:hypothetical protein